MRKIAANKNYAMLRKIAEAPGGSDALSSYIETGSHVALTGGLAALYGGLGTLTGSFGAALSAAVGDGWAAWSAAPLSMTAPAVSIPLSLLALAGGFALDYSLKIDTVSLRNQVIRRAAYQAGLPVGRYTQPSVEEIVRAGGRLMPRHVDAAFLRKLGVLNMLSKTSEGASHPLVQEYLNLASAGLIDIAAFEPKFSAIEAEIAGAIEAAKAEAAKATSL